MAKKLYEESNIQAIADAIRSKNGSTDTYKTSEMAGAIEEIEAGGGSGSDINPEWTDWRYFSYYNSRNSLVELLKYGDTSNGTDFSFMFAYCNNLTTIPKIDTSNGTNFINMFYMCEKLQTIFELDTSNGTNFANMFWNCYALENITFTGTFPIKSHSSVFSKSSKLTVDSLMSFINALSDNSGLSTTYTVTIGSTNLAKLTPEQIAIATNKNIILA